MAAITAWRTTSRAYAETAFDGKGAATYGGRWNPEGVPVVYLSASRALSVLEVLARVRGPEDLAGFVLIPATFDEGAIAELSDLPPDWRALPAPESTRRLGAAWARERRSLALRVPSVVVPAEANYVLNPLHPDFGAVEIGAAEPLDVDPRLF